MSILSQIFGTNSTTSGGFIKRIIKGQCTFNPGVGINVTDTINPPLTDINKASLNFYKSAYGNPIVMGNPQGIMVRGKIRDVSTVEFNRVQNTGSMTMVWEVTEYY